MRRQTPVTGPTIRARWQVPVRTACAPEQGRVRASNFVFESFKLTGYEALSVLERLTADILEGRRSVGFA